DRVLHCRRHVEHRARPARDHARSRRYSAELAMWIGAGLASMSALSTHTLLAHADESAATAWTIDTGKSRLVVHVYKKGLLSGFAHDHHFVPRTWRAEAIIDLARPERAQVTLWVDAASLSDDQPALSEDDRQKVERQASGSDILDASQYPQIR